MFYSVFYLISFLLLITSIRIKSEISDAEVCSKRNTTSINGFFILLVFASHLSGYTIDTGQKIDLVVIKFMGLLGQYIVACFLFFSGYGIYYSISTKGSEYIKKIPRNRFLKTWINFIGAVTIYIIFAIVFNRIEFNSIGFRKMLLSLIAWENIGNSNWYIFDICSCYLISFISFKLFENRYHALFFHLSLSIIFVFIISLCKAETCWSNTILCYTAGMFYCAFKSKFNIIFKRHFYLSIIMLLFLFTLIAVLNHFNETITNIYVYNINSIIFAFIFCVLQYRLNLNSKILLLLGENLFGIYIMQRLPMIYLQSYINSYYLYCILCLFLSLVIGYLFNLLTSKIDHILIL